MPTYDTSNASTTNTWYTWNGDWNSTASSTTWNLWCSSDTTSNACNAEYGNAYRQPTTEERAESERVRAEREERRRAAKAKAEALLQENLSERQREELSAHRYFTVEGGQSKRRYRVKAGMGCHGNIIEVDEAGCEVNSLCAAPRGDIPEGDYLLSQKLFLEHDEERFRQIANHRRMA
jgi:hypothetical protein